MRIWHNIWKTLVVVTVLWGGLGQSAKAQTANDQKPGSLLFYNIYTSSSTNAAAVNTLISITNTATDAGIAIHFYFVDALTCQVADAILTLTSNQTATFLASEIDPDVNGYIIAVAVDDQGRPTQHNFLIGSLFAKQTLGASTSTTHSYQLSAVAFAKLNNLAPTLSPDGTKGNLIFDGDGSGSSYEQLPAEVAIDSFESPATADTRLIIYSPRSDLFGPDSNPFTPSTANVRLFIVYFDEAENAFSASVGLACWLQARLTIIRNLAIRIGAGQIGWARMVGYRNNDRIPLLGSVVRASSFSGGHNLHHLSLLPSYTITIPVFPPR